MHRKEPRQRLGATARLAAGLLGILAYPGTAGAVDGVIEINQTRALAGGVTATDGPGFPVTLDAAGSYRLTSNLDVTSQANPQNVTVVQITANDVTLDLNGFAIIGPNTCSGIPPVCTANGSGIGVDGGNTAVEGITVRDGTIRGTGDDGILLLTGARVEGMFVTQTGGFGIFAGAASTVVRNRLVRIGGTQAITGGVASTLRDNSILFPASFGMVVSEGSTVTGNQVSFGVVGISASNSVVRDNAVRQTTGLGMTLSGASAGYVNNVLSANNGGDAALQLSGGFQMGTNVCGNSTVCP